MKYIKSIWKNSDEHSYLDYYELGENNYDLRRVCYYKDGRITAANEHGGYLGEEIAEAAFPKTLEEMNKTLEIITTEISKEEFESEWEKAISQPGFELKPYEWLEKK